MPTRSKPDVTEEKPIALVCPHGQTAELVVARWAQVEALDPKPVSLLAWCVCCAGPALMEDRDPWGGITCTRCEG